MWHKLRENGYGPPPSHSFIYSNLICELLHVVIINPKGLEVHPLGSTPGYAIIFELTLLIDQFYEVRVLIYPKSFVCLFLHFFVTF